MHINYEKCPKNRCFSVKVQPRHTIWHLLKKFRKPNIFQCFSPMVPQNYQKRETPEHIALMEKLIDIMEDDDDVQNIWHNWEE